MSDQAGIVNDSDEESISSSTNRHNGMEDDEDDTSASSFQSDHGATPSVGSSQPRALQNGNNCEGQQMEATPNLQKAVKDVMGVTVPGSRRTRREAAADAIVSGKQSFSASVRKHQVSTAEVEQALLERGKGRLVKQARLRRSHMDHRRISSTSLQLAMDDVMLRNTRITVTAKRHGITCDTLRRRLTEKGFQYVKTSDPVKLHKACRAVVRQGLSSKISGKQHGINPDRLRAELMAQGYVYQKSKGGWIKQSSKEDTKPDKQECQTDSEDETNLDEVTESAAEDEGVCGKAVVDENVSSPRKEGKSMERIVDHRVQRQYLIKWQGEEEPSWVDEDIFVGLACQKLC